MHRKFLSLGGPNSCINWHATVFIFTPCPGKLDIHYYTCIHSGWVGRIPLKAERWRPDELEVDAESAEI